MPSRRNFLVGAAAAAVAASSGVSARAEAEPLAEGRYRRWVPELYSPLASAPSHSDSIVIGSGFGASVAALRLSEAGRQVSILERGSRWPIDRWRGIFANDFLPDGRGFWRRTSFKPLTGLPTQHFDYFGGVLDATDHGDLQIWRGAAVGGGSIVFTGVCIAPPADLFQKIFTSVPADEMYQRYYPLARRMLKVSPMPDDVYNSLPFTHSREWDRQVRAAGYNPEIVDGIWNWDVIRDEISLRSRPSAIAGESNLGNSNGAKRDLSQTYLAQAERTGRAKIYPRHEVVHITRDYSNRYVLTVDILAPDSTRIRSRTLTCDSLFLGAGSMGTSALMTTAKATGALPLLNEHVGGGWGSNGDAALVRGPSFSNGLVQGAACRSKIIDTRSGTPVCLENWYVPGSPADVFLIGSLGMVMDTKTRGAFRYNASRRRAELDWPRDGNGATVQQMRVVQNRIARRNNIPVGVPLLGVKDVNAEFTAHPLGGMVIDRATDNYGRVRGYDNLYVVDGSLIPGTTGATNPSLTITALAERNIEKILAEGR